ncbi:MAG: hypothetical protein BGO68_04455 [Candidatus Amoebophilus sp. 36-38]|nr:MAG: hypothetical protein BGO68_04455 [Candidatus Amoebophilus sp. 36-38]
MHTIRKLLTDSNFRSCLVVHATYSLAKWISLSNLPLLVAQKFNDRDTLVLSLSLKLLPTIICAPLLANILSKIGFKKLTILGMLLLAIMQLGLIYTNHPIIFQGFILVTGIIDTVVTSCILVLRSQVIPSGKHIAGNASFSMVESIARIIGPALTAVMLWKLSLKQSFYGISTLLLLATIILELSQIPFKKATSRHTTTIGYLSFLKLFHKKPILWAIYIPCLGYAILSGTRNLFLFWTNKEIFHNHEAKWTLLLTAHGLGTILGSILGTKFLHWIKKRISLLQAFLYLGLLRSIVFLILSWVPYFKLALAMMVVLGLPEILETICFFTLLQIYLEGDEVHVFYTFNIPVYYTFVVLGTLTGELYTTNLITLQNLWLLTSLLSLISIVPFLVKAKGLNKKSAYAIQESTPS